MSFDERASGSDIGNFVTNTNGYLTLGDMAYGNISGSGGLGGDHDVYALQTQPGVTYTVVMRGAAWPGVAASPNPSPYFVVRNAAGTILGEAANVDGDQVYVFTGTALQQLFVDTQGALVASTGGYALLVASNVPDDFSGALPGRLAPGAQVRGRLETVGDDDPMLADTWAGDGYFFSTYSATVSDLSVTIRTPGGQTLPYDSINPGKGGSFVAPASATYSLHVTSASQRQVGDYEIFFQERVDPALTLSVGSFLADSMTFADSNPREVWGWAGNDTIRTGLVGDFLAGGAGDDNLDAGPGMDLAYFAAPSANFRVAKAGLTWTVSEKFFGAEGSDTLRNTEAIAFTDKAFFLVNLPREGVPSYNTNNGFLFDAAYYLLDNPELVPAVDLLTALYHYFGVGAALGLRPNSWFDANYYENRWPDLKAGNFSDDILFMHYNLYGVWEGRSAGPKFDKFDGNRYLTDNPDVAAYVDAHLPDFLGSRSNGAIAHYVIYGQHELRLAYDLVGQQIDLGYTIDLGG